jgi:hypothetical protein
LVDLELSEEFLEKYKDLPRVNKEKIKDSIGIILRIKFLERKLKERKSWIRSIGEEGAD